MGFSGCTEIGMEPPIQQVADWLEKLGMSEYVERFVKNDIDLSVLCHLTDQDLKEIGVSLGHRRKLLAVVAEMIGTTPTACAPVTAWVALV
jgi:hypothetical protein